MTTIHNLIYMLGMHICFIVFTIPGYLSCVNLFRWLSSKEIHKEDKKYWKREIPHLMCEMQKYLPPGFFNAQENYLIHQVEEI